MPLEREREEKLVMTLAIFPVPLIKTLIVSMHFLATFVVTSRAMTKRIIRMFC